MTSRFPGRIFEHREGLISGFTKKYGIKRLVWYETHESILSAIQREKSLKKYKRETLCIAGMGGRDKPGHDDLMGI